MASKAAHFDWSRVDSSQIGCWPWKGPLNTWGYGYCQLHGVSMNASRAAYISWHGYIPEGLVVCHSCDNPACCNPGHLRADTQANNLKDARDRGRQVYITGRAHHRATAKLTVEQVAEARTLWASGVSQSEIGRRMGVGSGTISRLVRGKTWAHVA